MLTIKSLLFSALFIVSGAGYSQKAANDSASEKKGPAFELKQYYFVMLTKGPNRTQDSATADKIQQGHMANIGSLSKAGKLVAAGPFGDDGNWRGIFIFDCKTQQEVEDLLKTDPAIKSGRLGYEIHPWWTAKNCVFK